MKKLVAIGICVGLSLACLPALAESTADEDETALKDSESETTKGTSNLSYTRKSPLVAGALSIVPGLGHVYNEDYVVGGIALAVETGLYLAAAGYAGLLDPNKKNTFNYESAFLLALAGGIHLFCIFDATIEASRRNENLDKWSVMVAPHEKGLSLAYSFRF